jgi:TolB-like protein
MIKAQEGKSGRQIMNKTICVALLLFSIWPASKAAASDHHASVRADSSGSQNGLDQQMADLSQQISREFGSSTRKTIAVVEFTDLKGEVTDLERFLSEELITGLYQTRKFKVIERQLLNKVIAEQKLSLTGPIDPASAKRLGKLLGVDAIVSGTVADLGDKLRINARLISAETGEVFAAASTTITKDSSVTALIGKGRISSPDGGDKPAEAPRQTVKTQKVDKEFFTIELLQCRLSGASVICDLRITNNDKDRNFEIGDQSRMFDDHGNQSRTRMMRLANSKSPSNLVQSLLVSGVPTPGSLTFEEVSPQATKITLLELNCHDGSNSSYNSWFKVQFRNICLTASCDPNLTPPSQTAPGRKNQKK